ncbi:MAG: transcriptional repressor LexA [Armatimonadetes bacterium]|nr:transcriptional repressor LexA [Armatimonadota bacterium]
MAKQLTARQREVLDTIQSFISANGYCPSIRELGPMLGISSLRGVTIHLDALQRKGWITRNSKSRAIRVLAPSADDVRSRRVPLLGTIAAGVPLLAVENIESYISVSHQMVGDSGSLFALKVRGDSMIDDHIMDGDIIVVHKQNSAKHGQIVAALIGEEATVKRLDLNSQPPRLLPSNANYEPIAFDSQDSILLGRIVGLIRSVDF